MSTSLGFFISARLALAKALCAAANHLLASEPQARAKLAAHRGKTLKVEGAVLLNVALTVQADDTFAPALEGAEPTLTLKVDVPKAATLSAQGREVSGAVSISGDAEFAAAAGWLASNLRWEFEEDLSRLIGAAGANRAGKIVRGVGDAMRQSARDTEAMLKRGFAETAAPLVGQAAFEPLKNEITHLRDTVARLEKRLELLERSTPNNKASS
jgi:ubiquinone biosynthesis accessory factor UbiJ